MTLLDIMFTISILIATDGTVTVGLNDINYQVTHVKTKICIIP